MTRGTVVRRIAEWRRRAPIWIVASTLAWTTSPCAADAAAGAAGTSSPDSTESAPRRDSDAIAYRVVIDAPRELVDTLRDSVDLVRWQSYEDMTADLFDRLVRDAVDQGREAASTHGYFSPTVDVTVDRNADPRVVTLHVEPGAPTRIADVNITVTGPAADDPGAGAAAIAELKREWGLAQGDIFRQTAWNNAKTRAVATLASSPYAAARIVASEARIDPATRRAELSVELASGPPFRVGRIEVTGLSRYDPALVRNYSTIRPGDPYSGAALDQYLRRLNGTGYFASARATIDTDIAQADDATVKVAIIEAPTRHFEGGVGYSTDTEFRVNAGYRDVNVDGHGLQFHTEARVESLLQSGTLRLVRPPGENGWIDSYTVKYERTTLNDLETKTAAAGVRRASLDERNQWQYGAVFMDDQLLPTGGEDSKSHALYVDVERTWRRVDDLVAPTRGWILDTQAGAGIPGASTRSFVRAVARFAYWYPLGRDYQFTARAEGGAVAGASRQEVPSPLLFRTGGDTTVRGYAFNSLGITDGKAIVPGRYYLVGSMEVTRWINPTWGIAAFVDAGNAFDNAADFKTVLGYGVGARVRTPIGPFRLDVAYGQESRQVRIHFSVGLSF
jgi:translocation and assembly module TamA